LFFHPENKASIDGDIIEKEGKFYLFFKTEGSGNGIMKAVSDSLTGGYVLIDKTLQQTTQAVEGSSVFRMINSDEFILMYDMYSSGTYQFTVSRDLENFSIIDNSISMNFHPRHGTVIPITKSEAELLSQEWGRTVDLQVYDVQGDNVLENTIAIDNTTKKVSLTISEGDLSAYNPKLVTLPGATISPLGAVDFTNGAVNFTLSIDGVGSVDYSVEVNTNLSALHPTVKNGNHFIYPNPTRDYLIVDAPCKSLNNNKLCVFNAAGVQVVSAKVTARVTTIDVWQLKESPYYLVYTMDDKVLWSDTFLVK
jgi:arabinoxylan arabinofuranohydrolase